MVFKPSDFNYRDSYESLWWPRPYYEFEWFSEKDYILENMPMWLITHPLAFRIYRAADSVSYYLHEFFVGFLFSRRVWDPSISPSFATCYHRIKKNLNTFLTPWYTMRRKFMCAFANKNDCKLLDDDYNNVYVRNRKRDCAYYSLDFCGFRYTLTKKIILDKNGEATNGFLAGISIAFSDKPEEEKREEAKLFTEKTEVVCTGWVFNVRTAIRELNKISKLTPDLDWDSDCADDETEQGAK